MTETICPRCAHPAALTDRSRVTDQRICANCGRAEAMRDHLGHAQATPEFWPLTTCG